MIESTPGFLAGIHAEAGVWAGPLTDAAIREARRLVASSRRAAAFTGAGVSTESGIPDYRSPGGTWTRETPVHIDAYVTDPAVRTRTLRRFLLGGRQRPQPNAAHHALARLEQDGHLAGIVTQNVDGLHQAAGSRVVHELHGNGLTASCLVCRASWEAEAVLARMDDGVDDPRCPLCGGILKPDVVFFGEALPAATVTAAERLVQEADLLLVAGTSLQVWPAAAIPRLALRRGIPVILLTLSDTDLDADVTVRIRALAGPALSAIAHAGPA